MSDEEDVETFEGADAGTAEAYPMEAGQIKKGGYIMIKGHPCKVINVSTSKTGKHGHAKCHFTAIDIFTDKKMDDILSSTHGTTVPNVFRAEYTLLDIDEDGACSLMTEGGDMKDDLNLPPDDKLAAELKANFDEGKELLLGVIRACGIEQIMSYKEATA